jgi:hypothetical protein
LGLELEVPVPDEPVALEAEDGIDGPVHDRQVDDVDGRDPHAGGDLADVGEETLALAFEERLERTVGVHEGRQPFRESESILSRAPDRAGPAPSSVGGCSSPGSDRRLRCSAPLG